MGSDTKHSPRGLLNGQLRPSKFYCGMVALCYMGLAVALLFDELVRGWRRPDEG